MLRPGSTSGPTDPEPSKAVTSRCGISQAKKLPDQQAVQRHHRREHRQVGPAGAVGQLGRAVAGPRGEAGRQAPGHRDRAVLPAHPHLRPAETAGDDIPVAGRPGIDDADPADPGGGEQGDDLGAHPAGAVHPHLGVAPALQRGEPAVGRAGGEREPVQIGLEPVALGHRERAQRAGTRPGVVDHAPADQQIEQGPAALLPDPRVGRADQHPGEIPDAVQALDPAADLGLEIGQHHRVPGVQAELQGAFVAA